MPQFITVETQSSNAVVTVHYSDASIVGINSPAGAAPKDTAGLADQVALARVVLTVLAHPAMAAAATMIAAASTTTYTSVRINCGGTLDSISTVPQSPSR